MGKRFIVSEEAVTAAKQHTAPCSDCPWSRKSFPGWTGPNTVDEWIRCAHSDQRIDCHTRKQQGGEPWQCAGAAIYRTHICKFPRHPGALTLPANEKLVFSWGEFEAHHGKEAATTDAVDDTEKR